MNSLSWLIYAGDVTTPTGYALGIFGSVFLVIGLIAFVITTCIQAEDPDEKISSTMRKLSGRFAVAGAVMCATAALIPSRNAIYMIAASEMGEKAVTTPEAKEMLGDLREVIAKQIKKLKDDK